MQVKKLMVSQILFQMVPSYTGSPIFLSPLYGVVFYCLNRGSTVFLLNDELQILAYARLISQIPSIQKKGCYVESCLSELNDQQFKVCGLFNVSGWFLFGRLFGSLADIQSSSDCSSLVWLSLSQVDRFYEGLQRYNTLVTKIANKAILRSGFSFDLNGLQQVNKKYHFSR